MQLRTIVDRYIEREAFGPIDDHELATFRLLIRRVRSTPAPLRSPAENADACVPRNINKSDRSRMVRDRLNRQVAALLGREPIPFTPRRRYINKNQGAIAKRAMDRAIAVLEATFPISKQ